jgi:hypothetical protein
VQLVQAATNQSAYQTAYHTAYGAADAGGFANLRGLDATALGFFAATRVCTARGRLGRWRRRGFMFISV